MNCAAFGKRSAKKRTNVSIPELSLLLTVVLCACSTAPRSLETPTPAHIGADGTAVPGSPEPEVVRLKSVETTNGELHVIVGNIAGDYVLVCNLDANEKREQNCVAPFAQRDYLLFRQNTKWQITGAQEPIDLDFMEDFSVKYNDKENVGLIAAKKSENEIFHVFWLSSWTARSPH